jgi:hypothetical protein
MAEYNVLPWQNENSLSSYPLVFPLDFDGFIVDASFIQFDYFVPVLNTIFIGTDHIEITITFDKGQLTQTYSNSQFNAGIREIRFIENNNRYLGCITVGEKTTFLWENFVGQNLIKNIPFLATVVKSIPSKDAVYTLDSLYGDIVFGVELEEVTSFSTIGGFNFQNNLIGGLVFQNTGGGSNIFYNYNINKNALVFNAVANHTFPEASVWALKRINLVPPINNNIYLASNDVLKFKSINNQKLQISLAGESASGASLVPTLTS